MSSNHIVIKIRRKLLSGNRSHKYGLPRDGSRLWSPRPRLVSSRQFPFLSPPPFLSPLLPPPPPSPPPLVLPALFLRVPSFPRDHCAVHLSSHGSVQGVQVRAWYRCQSRGY